MLSWILVVYGYIGFVSLTPLLWIIFAPILLILTIYYVTSFGINLGYKKFDIKKHESLVRAFRQPSREFAKIDIYLPICGESYDVLKQTWRGVRELDYPNMDIYVLDDKGDDKARRLAVSMGFTYVSRPSKGVMKKAGNLEYAINMTCNDFFIIFDADFVPKPEFITELLPYMDNPKVAIVQTPQFFDTDSKVHKRSSLEFGAGHVQEDFYRIIQVARDRFDGAICVGSNALYRREAIDNVGGTAQIEHSEDVHTGFKLIQGGYKVKYLPLVLARGLCPDQLDAFFKQQNRWCNGSMSLIFSRKFWMSRLSIAQKICYVSGLLYYISHVIAMVLPFQLLLVLYFHAGSLSLTNALPFIPFFVYGFVLLPLSRITKPRRGTYLAITAITYSYFYAIISTLTKKQLKWVPTNTVKKTTSKEFANTVKFSGIYLAAYLGLLMGLIISDHFPYSDFRYWPLYFFIGYNLITHGGFFLKCIGSVIALKRKARRALRQQDEPREPDLLVPPLKVFDKVGREPS